MSRSYKKVYGSKDSNKFMKNYANRRLRGVSFLKTPMNGCHYKKYICQYNICDWRSIDFGSEYSVLLDRKRYVHVWQYRLLGSIISVDDKEIMKDVKKSRRK